MGERPRRAGENALESVAGEVAGLGTGIDEGRADPHPVQEIRKLNGLHRADLHALAALDAGGEKLLLLEPVFQRSRRTQARIGVTGERKQPG